MREKILINDIAIDIRFQMAFLIESESMITSSIINYIGSTVGIESYNDVELSEKAKRTVEKILMKFPEHLVSDCMNVLCEEDLDECTTKLLGDDRTQKVIDDMLDCIQASYLLGFRGIEEDVVLDTQMGFGVFRVNSKLKKNGHYYKITTTDFANVYGRDNKLLYQGIGGDDEDLAIIKVTPKDLFGTERANFANTYNELLNLLDMNEFLGLFNLNVNNETIKAVTDCLELEYLKVVYNRSNPTGLYS